MSAGVFSAFELGGGQSASEDRALVGLGRELASLDAGEATLRPRFVAAVMAAVAAEPTPRPSAAWVAALKRRRPMAAVAALRDSFRVAFGPAARPWRARAAAVPLALATVLTAGSLGVVGAGAAGVRLPDSSTPPPSAPVVAPSIPTSPVPSPAPSSAPVVEPSPSPSAEPPEREGGDLTGTPIPTPGRTPRPASSTPKPSDDGSRDTPKPSDDGSRDTPEPSGSESHDTPEPSGSDSQDTPRPTTTAGPGDD